MPVSDTAREALFAQETDEVFLECVEITADGIDPIRLVHNTQDIISGGNLYKAVKFKLLFPSGKLGSSNKATVELSNIDRQAVEVVRSSQNPLVLTSFLIRASEPDLIEQGPFEFTLRNTRWSASTLSAELYDDVDGNIAIPKIHYNSQDFPGLY